jgi:hypothetical protein
MSFLKHSSIIHKLTNKVSINVSAFSLKLICSFLLQRCTKRARDNCSVTSQVTGTLLTQRLSAFSGSLFFLPAMFARSSQYHYVHITAYIIFLPASNFKVGHSKWRFLNVTYPSKFKPKMVCQCLEQFILNRIS